MRLILATQGTLGDHLPMVGLAQHLMEYGFEVRLACNREMHAFVQAAGVQPLTFGMPLASVEACEKALFWDHWQNPPQEHIWSEKIEKSLTSDVSSLIKFLRPGDVLVGAKNLFFLPLVARASGCSLIEVGLNPASMIDYSRLPTARDSLQSWALGLRHLERRLRFYWLGQSDSSPDPDPMLRLHAVPDVMTPFHYPLLSAIQTGFWCYQHPEWNDWVPTESLQQALRGRPAPLGLIFSSQPLHQPVKVLSDHLEVAQHLGRRLVVVKGWAFGDESQRCHPDLVSLLKHPDLIVLDPLPLEWLFQRLDAVFIHGGIGTFARALQAGCHVVIEPYGNDQFLNARLAMDNDLALVIHPHRWQPLQVVDALKLRLGLIPVRLNSEDFEGLSKAASMISKRISSLG